MGKNGDLKIWMIDEKQIDKIVDIYIDYVTNPYHYYRQTIDWLQKKLSSDISNINCPAEERALKYDDSYRAQLEHGDNLPIQIMNLPKPNRNKIKQHFISLIHQIFLAYLNSKNNFFYLNAHTLQSVHRHYNFMLKVLVREQLLHSIKISQGSFARNKYGINQPELFKYKTHNNFIVKKDIEKIKKEFKVYHDSLLNDVKKKTSDKFISDYNKSLSHYKLIDKEGAINYIENELKKDTSVELYRSKLYHNNIIDKFNLKFKKVNSSDDNGRIYHIVTITPREIRKFTNISFIIDIKNSHPLLFNYLIYEYYFNYNNIDINNNKYKSPLNKYYYLINLFIINNNPYVDHHYFMQCLHIYLYNNKLPDNIIEIIKKIKIDVFQYIYSTSTGKLWDDIENNYPQFSRDEIKVQMFSSLFYSKSKNIYKKQVHANAFKNKYPTITKILRHYKKTFKDQCIEREITKYHEGEYIAKIQIAQ